MKHFTLCKSLWAVALCLFVAFQPAQAAVPVLDGGWVDDLITAANADSVSSPYVFNLPNPAIFRITDAFIVGDQYKVFDFGGLILTTALNTPAVRTPFGDDPFADAAWVSASYQHGEVLLAAGPHQLTVQGDGVGGLPAGFFVRLDSDTSVIPEPGSMLLLSLGAAGLAGYGWRRRQRATV